MGAKIYGYVMAFIGLVLLLISPKKFLELTPFKSFFPSSFLLVLGLILVGMGIILVMSESKSKSKLGIEVPIYKGKDIVGYRILK